MRRNLLIGAGLFIVTFAVFSRLLTDDFVSLDDDQSVYQNPHVQGLDWERVCWMFTDATHAVRYKPLTWLCYALIHQCSGLNPFSYHLVSLVSHCLNAVLVFAVVRRLLALAGKPDDAASGQLEMAATVGALLWAVNPLRVEPVARVTDMTYCLSFFFLLLSLWSYLPKPGEVAADARGCYWCSVGAFAVAMLVYPFACGYVLLLAALDWYPLRRLHWFGPWWEKAATRRVALEKIPFVLLGGIILVTWFARLAPSGIWTSLPSAQSVNPIKQAIQAAYVCVYYLWKPWLPVHLAPVYSTLIWFNPRTWPFWSSVLVAGGIVLLLWQQRHRWPWAVVLGVAHSALLVSALGLTELAHNTYDRYDYMAGSVWAVMLAALIWKCAGRSLRAVALGGAALLAVFWSCLSFHQERIWRNTETLFQYTLSQQPKLSPYRSLIYGYLGTYYSEHGRVGEAIQQFQSSLSIQPSVAGYSRLAMLLETNGAPEGALTNYLGLLDIYSDPDAHVHAAVLFAAGGRIDEAISHYRQALQIAPESVAALNNLAWILATASEPANRSGVEAVELAERACALTRSDVPQFLGTLAAAYAEAGRFPEAIEKGEKAGALAEAAGDAALAKRNRELVARYRQGQPYHEVRGGP